MRGPGLMRVRLLGPVDLLVDGAPKPVPGLRRKAVLAALALHPGEVVSTDQLIDVVWGDAPPAMATPTLQSHLSQLRSMLGARAAILARPPGYLLQLDAEATDVAAAQHLIRQATQSTDPGRAATQLQAAVALWRGRPLADITGLAWFDEQARRLEQLLDDARHALVDARLALGQHTELIPELRSLTERHPHHEQTHGQLILALYRAGRQGDALAAYQQLRRTLDDDLGVAPSRQLRDLETAILRQDRALDRRPPPGSHPSPGVGTVPAQLPSTTAVFTGRTRELAQLDRLLPAAGSGDAQPGPMVIAAVSGTAGVGKTTLTVHWAHRVADRFPDGQLYVNLRGYDPAGAALHPSDVIRQFLQALGLPDDELPGALDARVGLYRSMLAGKRVLVVLDNARDVHQARPLLPGAPGCLAVVTSRDQLIPLVIAEGAVPITLPLLSTVDARALLDRRLGRGRTDGESDAVGDIITRCAGLPLALAIVAARAATHPHLPLAAASAELHDAATTLATLDGGDPATDVRAVFSWSYHTLSPATARLFRLCSLHPGPDLTAAAAASLIAAAPAQARSSLHELTRANLLIESAPGRYTCHDLLRAYATDVTHTVDTHEQRHDATHRLLDHYLHTAHPADRLLNPTSDPTPLDPARPGVVPEPPADDHHARAWFAAEHRVLLATVRLAADTGFHVHVWQLASALHTFLNRGGHWHDLAATWQLAIDAAGRLDDPSAQARAHRGRARADIRLGRLDDAHANLEHALRLYHDLDDPTGQAHIHLDIDRVYEQQDRHRDSINHARRAFTLFRAAGHKHGQARALNSAGWSQLLLGDHAQALAACEQALALFQDLADRSGQANTWHSLGRVHHLLGRHTQAIVCYRHAIDLFRDGDRYHRAVALRDLGDLHHDAGDHDAAPRAWRDALAILDELHHPDADEIRAKLTAPTAPAGNRHGAGARRQPT